MEEARQESSLESERASRYLGTARIGLKWLHIDVTEVSQKHVQTLKSRFAKDCCRLDPRNHIPAIINRVDYDSALRISSLSDDLLRKNSNGDYPDLTFWPEFKLECLHGRHRLEAAKLALLPSDRWWTVDLYHAGLSTDLRRCIAEEYSNEGKPCDGQIYRKIRKYHFDKRSDLEMRWWTRLSNHRANNLKQLLQHEKFTAAFDSFLEVPAILNGLRLSTMHKVFALRCDEEVLHYLSYIKAFWSALCSNDKSIMIRLNQRTIEELQLSAPWASKSDFELVHQKVSRGTILDGFDQREREFILNRLRSFKGLVPSLYEFFENIKCLDAWAGSLRWLCCLSPRDTMSTALANIFSGGKSPLETVLIQTSENGFQSVPASLPVQRDLGIRQLYAFAMRNHREIPAESRRKNLLANPTPLIDKSRLRDLADLANELGFQSMQITALRNQPKIASMADKDVSKKPRLVTDGSGESRKDRCGMSRAYHYEQDRCSFFIHYLHEVRNEQSNDITNFFRMRSVYLKFFGTYNLQIYSTVDANNSTILSLSLLLPKKPPHLISNNDDPEHENSTSIQERILRIQDDSEVQTHFEEMDLTNEHDEEQDRQRLCLEKNQLLAFKQENQQMRQQTSKERATLQEDQEDYERKHQKLCLERNKLLAQKQEQLDTRRDLMEEKNQLQEMQQEQERQRKELVLANSSLSNLKREHAHEYQAILQERGSIAIQEQEVINARRIQQEQQQYLHSEEKKIGKSFQDLQELQIHLEKAQTEVLEKQIKISQEQSEQDMEELRRFQQEQLLENTVAESTVLDVYEVVSEPRVVASSASSSMEITDPNALERCGSTKVAKTQTLDDSEAIPEKFSTTSPAKSSSTATRHQFAEASFAPDGLGRYEPTKVANTGTLDNSKAILEQCTKTSSTKSSPTATRHEFADASSARIFTFGLGRGERTQVVNMKMPDNSKGSAVQCAMTLPVDCSPIRTRHEVTEANPSLVAINRNALTPHEMKPVTETQIREDHNPPASKRRQSDSNEEDIGGQMIRRGRKPTENNKYQRLGHYWLPDDK